MCKNVDAAKVPGAGKKNGNEGSAGANAFPGTVLKRPRVEFPPMERDGVSVMFFPSWDRDGKHVGWCISVLNPVANALAAADCALATAIRDDDTADFWEDLIPTFRRGGECLLRHCSVWTVRRFVVAAKRNGFKVVADDSAKAKGGAE